MTVCAGCFFVNLFIFENLDNFKGMALRVTVLGSGSSGNCTLVEAGDVSVLVDVGFSGRQIKKRMEETGRDLEEVDAVLVTHEHSDHTAGLPVLAGKMGLPVYCNRLTSEFLQGKLKGYGGWKLFRSGDCFEIGELKVESFRVPHDAYDPVGYVLEFQEARMAFLTDLGYVPGNILERMRAVDGMILESNYDPELLRSDRKRPWAVKQRIMARHGHLSNEGAAKLAGEVVNERLRHLFLGHLSGDCNRPDLARQAVEGALMEREMKHVAVYETYQDRPIGTVEVVSMEKEFANESH